MKRIVYLFLGLMLGAGSASAQVIGFPPRLDSVRVLVAVSEGKVRAMAPDRMPCMVPDLARVERMPMLRSANKDPMPNGFRLGGFQPLYAKPVLPFYFKPGDK
jgi:hypothetical protein